MEFSLFTSYGIIVFYFIILFIICTRILSEPESFFHNHVSEVNLCIVESALSAQNILFGDE